MLINSLLTSVFVLVNGIVFSRSNGLIIQYFQDRKKTNKTKQKKNSIFNSMFVELKEVKYFIEITDFKNLIM